MIRVMIIDDVDVIRAGISASLAKAEDIECIGEASDGDNAIKLIRQKTPDAVLMDFHMPPGIDGLELIKRIKQASEYTKIIIITIDADLHRLSRTLKMGVDGIILKNDRDLIPKAIRAVTQGKRYLQPDMAYDLMQALLNDHELQELNQTQYKILLKTAEGKKPQMIAKELNITPKFVSNELVKIKKRLKVKSTAELIRMGAKYLPD